MMKQNRKGSRKGQDFTAQGINNVANAFKDITTKKIPDAIGKITGEREGSRNGSTVQQVIDVFDDPDVPDEELLRIARELPDGVGEEVLKSLFVGSWRGDDPVEKEFFKIIESKISRNGSRKESRSGGIQDEIKNYLSGTNYATSDDDEEIEGILDNLSGHLQSQGYSADDAENGIGYYQDPYDSYQEPKLGARKGDSRKGSSVSSTGNFPTCDLDSTSGKGSRPSDLGSIASKIASGRNRSINVPGEYEE